LPLLSRCRRLRGTRGEDVRVVSAVHLASKTDDVPLAPSSSSDSRCRRQLMSSRPSPSHLFHSNRSGVKNKSFFRLCLFETGGIRSGRLSDHILGELDTAACLQNGVQWVNGGDGGATALWRCGHEARFRDRSNSLRQCSGGKSKCIADRVERSWAGGQQMPRSRAARTDTDGGAPHHDVARQQVWSNPPIIFMFPSAPVMM